MFLRTCIYGVLECTTPFEVLHDLSPWLVIIRIFFLCLEIIGVFKFFDAKFFYPKIFGHENFRIYGIT